MSSPFSWRAGETSTCIGGAAFWCAQAESANKTPMQSPPRAPWRRVYRIRSLLHDGEGDEQEEQAGDPNGHDRDVRPFTREQVPEPAVSFSQAMAKTEVDTADDEPSSHAADGPRVGRDDAAQHFRNAVRDEEAAREQHGAEEFRVAGQGHAQVSLLDHRARRLLVSPCMSSRRLVVAAISSLLLVLPASCILPIHPGSQGDCDAAFERLQQRGLGDSYMAGEFTTCDDYYACEATCVEKKTCADLKSGMDGCVVWASNSCD